MSAEDEDLKLAEQEQELPPEAEERKKKGVLRTGFSTGTTATAATKGALYTLIAGEHPEHVVVSLPKGRTATLKIKWTNVDGAGRVTCTAVKDGGDDPDVTHGSEICSTVSFNKNAGR